MPCERVHVTETLKNRRCVIGYQGNLIEVHLRLPARMTSKGVSETVALILVTTQPAGNLAMEWSIADSLLQILQRETY